MPKHPTNQASRSPLKWAGGKHRLLPLLLPLFPHGDRLIEPFVGAGSVFLGTSYAGYLLNDANPDLMAFWSALKNDADRFVEAAQLYFDDQLRSDAAYRQIRHDFNATADSFERAVRLLYLNRFGFNGLYRVNRHGEYNVPYGKPVKVPGFPVLQCQLAAERLQSAELCCGDFERVMANGGKGDVIYCDPPYLNSTCGESFSAYTASGFGQEDHFRLMRAAQAAAGRGATVLISNHDTTDTRKLYREFELHAVNVRRSVSAEPSSRGMASELVAVLRP